MTPEASGAVVVEKELDALVARQVMGWEPAEMLGPSRAQAFWADEDVLVVPRDFSPSTSISDAWRVVERMRELGWSYEICGGPTRHSVSFCEIATDTLEFAHHADAPRAICLAALKALGVTV